jgi:tRNA threonylcarbamoyladenosine biosynthesis protein TsaB
MTALSIDTATESLGLCLEADGSRRTLVAEAGLRHSETLLPGIRQLLEQAGVSARELDLVVCCLGPGSFTGIRIGLATAKGLCFRGNTPLIGIANLDALAYRFRSYAGPVVPVIPALRRNYYAAVYQRGERESEYLSLSLESLIERLDELRSVLLTGPAAETLCQRLPASASPIVDLGGPSTDPVSLLELGKKKLSRLGVPQEDPEPLYLRKSDAEINRGSRADRD